VYRLPDGRVFIEGVEIFHRRFQTSSTNYSEVADEAAGQVIANQYLAREFL
jgi:hypothetical protein